jgi:hypothetical protein
VQELLAGNAKTASNIAGTIEKRLLDRPYQLDNPATHGGATERASQQETRQAWSLRAGQKWGNSCGQAIMKKIGPYLGYRV